MMTRWVEELEAENERLKADLATARAEAEAWKASSNRMWEEKLTILDQRDGIEAQLDAVRAEVGRLNEDGIKRLTELAAALGAIDWLKAENEKLKEERKHLFCRDEI